MYDGTTDYRWVNGKKSANEEFIEVAKREAQRRVLGEDVIVSARE